MPRNIEDLVKSLERVRDLSFKAGIAETELEVRDWNMRIHQEVSKTLDGPLPSEDMDIVVKYTPPEEKENV